MKYYLVKETSKATEANVNFKGMTSITYFGKAEEQIAYDGDYKNAEWEVRPKLEDRMWMVREYGYKRECDARRSYIYKNPENSKFWESTVEIVSVEA